jgi:hypothetical protein
MLIIIPHHRNRRTKDQGDRRLGYITDEGQCKSRHGRGKGQG